ncbi:MAG: hypothetical protein V4857_03400 [Pseudomonadota bacterium]
MDTWDNDAATGAGWAEQLVERFTIEVHDRLGATLPRKEQAQVVAIARQALSQTIGSLNNGPRAGTLPVERLKPSEVISQGKVNMSQATLYRAADQGRFYCTTPGGRNIGKEFPAWQFVDPVPELIAAVLAQLADRAASEVHAFWVTAADELNELCPAELLAGMPFATRSTLHPSQQALLRLGARARQSRLIEFAATQSSSKEDVIG